MWLLLSTPSGFQKFGMHQSTWLLLSAHGYRRKVKFIRIDGSTPPDTRGGLVDKFQHNADVRLAILSINAAGTGLTLTVITT